MALIALSGGCQFDRHTTAKAAAEKRWNAVRADIKLQLAEQAYLRLEFDEALRSASEAVALDPQSARGYAVLGWANLEVGKEATARRTLAAAEEAGAWSPELSYLRGVLLQQEGKLQSALLNFIEARRADPTDANYLIAHAECLVEMNRPQAALDMLTANRGKLDQGNAAALMAARLAAMLGDGQTAVTCYREALVQHAANELLVEEFGLLLARLHFCDEALAQLLPLLGEQSTAEGPKRGERSDWTEGPALGTLGSTPQPPFGARHAPAQAAVRRAVAACYLELDRPLAAQQVLEPYATAHPTDLQAQLLLARAALAGGNESAALRAAGTAYQHSRDEPQAMLLLAMVHHRLGADARAAEVLSELFRTHPDDVDAHCLMAEVLASRGDLAAAREHFEQALDLDPTCAWALAGIASIPS